jgi:hypothetical protein
MEASLPHGDWLGRRWLRGWEIGVKLPCGRFQHHIYIYIYIDTHTHTHVHTEGISILLLSEKQEGQLNNSRKRRVALKVQVTQFVRLMHYEVKSHYSS